MVVVFGVIEERELYLCILWKVEVFGCDVDDVEGFVVEL